MSYVYALRTGFTEKSRANLQRKYEFAGTSPKQIADRSAIGNGLQPAISMVSLEEGRLRKVCSRRLDYRNRLTPSFSSAITIILSTT